MFRSFKKVANRDLWEELSGIIESLAAAGTEVSFWLIPPGGAVKQDSVLVRETKDAAREAATSHYDAVATEFTRLCGIMV
ncbi:Uu.00g128920.m01.CDS01 [Anthostomella pinea]|uniref:Uu.00g128920.m01.CDS01 n=1 Tax=Anthostomella pinea TaxID=933095 RepID=A0AAI8VIB9_9PEZI|nr:Uu.00g128920.m01.CDS01 [Anthostomella pinea]